MAEHILVVDDDERLRSLLEQYLSDQGFVVSTASNAAIAREKLIYFDVDMMVLDVMMPGETGLSLAESLGNDAPPILMLSAMGEAEDRIKGLEIGVDDYLTKPFEPRELVLRINNIKQRHAQNASNKNQRFFGPFRFDIKSGQLFEQDEVIYLTSSESLCLKALAEHAGEPVARERLAELTGQSKSNERSVDVQINRLRKKIEPIAGRPTYIQTVRGAGYVLHAQEQI